MTINVAGDENTDLNKVVHSLGRLLGVSPNIFLVDNNLKYLLSNIDKLKAVFLSKAVQIAMLSLGIVLVSQDCLKVII